MPQKGKHKPPHHKGKKQHDRVQTQNIQASPAAATLGSVPSAATTVDQRPAATVPRPSFKPTARPGAAAQLPLARERYPYLTTELKWIGIVAAAIIVILIVLAIIIPPLFA